MDPTWGNQCFQKQGFLPGLEGQLLSPGHSRGRAQPGERPDFGRVARLSGASMLGAWKGTEGDLGIFWYMRPPQEEGQTGGCLGSSQGPVVQMGKMRLRECEAMSV